MAGILGVLAVIGTLVFAGAQLVAGYAGIAEGIGAVWAWLAVAVAFLMRFTLPITIGAFFGAMNVWEWHWAAALIFAVPGLLFLVPTVMVGILSMVRR